MTAAASSLAPTASPFCECSTSHMKRPNQVSCRTGIVSIPSSPKVHTNKHRSEEDSEYSQQPSEKRSSYRVGATRDKDAAPRKDTIRSCSTRHRRSKRLKPVYADFPEAVDVDDMIFPGAIEISQVLEPKKKPTATHNMH